MKKLYTFFCLAVIHNYSTAQSNQELISASGDHYINSTVQLSWSIGEIVIETKSNSTNIITQGFHQTNLSVVGIEDYSLSTEINVYPNPTTFMLSIEVDKFEELNYQLFDINGKLISTSVLVQNTTSISVAKLATGSYILKVVDSKTNKSKNFQIIKQ